ncbi:MAG: DUF58 domain-containing protein [Pirellulales bacterium]
MNASAKYFDPETLSRIGPLGLRARTLVEGLIAGLHRSPLRGHSIEFAQHREYTPGDDTRQIDWKVYARSDKYYLKQYEDETSLICTLLLDTSESMTFRGPKSSLSKLEIGQLIAAALGYLILSQQDACGFGTFSQGLDAWLQPSSSPVQFDDLVRVMEQSNVERKSDIYRSVSDCAAHLSHAGMVVIISDLFDDVDRLGRALKLLKYERQDVLVLQVLDPIEINFELDRTTKFVGLEQLPSLTADPRLIGAAYRKAMRTLLDSIAAECRQLDVDHHLITTDQSLAHALAQVLARRRLVRG